MNRGPDYTNAFFCLVWQLLKWVAVHLVIALLGLILFVVAYFAVGDVNPSDWIQAQGAAYGGLIILLMVLEIAIDLYLITSGFGKVRAAFWPYDVPQSRDVASVKRVEPALNG